MTYIVRSGNKQLEMRVNTLAEAKRQAARYGELGYGKGTYEQVTKESAHGRHRDYIFGYPDRPYKGIDFPK